MRSIAFLASSTFIVVVTALIFTPTVLHRAPLTQKSSVSVSPASNGPLASCTTDNYTGIPDSYEKLAFFDNQQIPVPEIADDVAFVAHTNVLGVSNEEKWIEVDLSDQKLYAWEGNNLYLESPISSGLKYYPTPTGEFHIWIKLRATKMEGGSGAYYYYLPNVPFVMYFENDQVPGWKGYGLHGAYWHNDFGTPRSHGCVNLPIPVAEQLYYWVTPVLSDNANVQRSSSQNPGTRLVIHE